MKAVNLIPAEENAAGGTSSGIGVYAVLGVLAVLVVMSAMYTLVGRSLDQKRADVAAVTSQAQAAEKSAATYKQFTEFADTRKARVDTVKNVADTRFDWAGSLREVARTLPSGSWVKSMRLTVTPAVTVDGGTDPLRASLAVPAIELTGCARTQDTLARVLVSLRQMSGVQRVSLSKSARSTASSGGDGQSDSAGSQDCGRMPAFSLTVFYTAPEGPAATASATGTAATTTTPAATAAATTTGGTTP